MSKTNKRLLFLSAVLLVLYPWVSELFAPVSLGAGVLMFLLGGLIGVVSILIPTKTKENKE